MGRTTCTEPQRLCKGVLYLYLTIVDNIDFYIAVTFNIRQITRYLHFNTLRTGDADLRF